MNAFHWQGQPSIFNKERMKSAHQHRIYATQVNHSTALGAHTKSTSTDPLRAEKRRQKVLDIIKATPGIHMSEIVKQSGFSKTYANVIAIDLRRDGSVIRRMVGKIGQYELAEGV